MEIRDKQITWVPLEVDGRHLRVRLDPWGEGGWTAVAFEDGEIVAHGGARSRAETLDQIRSAVQ